MSNKLLTIILSLGIGFCIGAVSMNQYLTTDKLEKEESLKIEEIDAPKELKIVSSRIIKGVDRYQIVAEIKNSSDKLFTVVFIEAYISDSKGIIDDCDSSATNVKPGISTTFLFCSVTNEQYPDVKITDIKVKKVHIFHSHNKSPKFARCRGRDCQRASLFGSPLA